MWEYLYMMNQQEDIHKNWDDIYFLLTQSFGTDEKTRMLNSFIKFLKKYIREYLKMFIGRTSQINNYIEDIIDKMIYLEFLKYYIPRITREDLKVLLNYLQERKENWINIRYKWHHS